MGAKPQWIVGAYAASSQLQPWNADVQRRFWAAMQELPSVRGLELPVSREGAEEVWKALPQDWDFVLTLLPATMQALARQPDFGLASRDSLGFQAALDLAEIARAGVARLNDLCGRQAVLAVHLHSAARRGAGDPQQLARGFEILLQRDWSGAALVLEHCDAFRPPQSASKGFLELEAELGVLSALGLGMTLNWGRSVLETRRTEGALEHLARVRQESCLKGFMFSGMAVGDPLYGDWQDSHAPISLGGAEPWEARGGLLRETELRAACAQLALDPPEVLGLKVQFFPAELSLEERIAGLRLQLEALNRAWP